MSKHIQLEQWFNNVESDDFEHLKLDFAVLVEKAMNTKEMSRVQLANALEVSPSRITKILSGDANLTLEVIAKVAAALDQKLHVHFAPRGAKVHVFNAICGQDEVFGGQSEGFNRAVVKLSKYKPLAIAA